MYLLDTDTLIYSLKGHKNVVENFRIYADAPKAISVISYGELVFGAEKSVQIAQNLAKVHRLREVFPVIDLSCSIMDTFGSIKAELERKGKTVDDFDLLNFDVYHFESGMDFFKDSSFAKKVKKQGKKIVCHYHGEDLRTRGAMPELDAISDLNLTSEVDLLGKHPNINYLFLPFDTDSFTTKHKLNNPVRVCHAPTNRYYKGSAAIIAICKKLVSDGIIVFDLIENLPHQEALKRKLEGDIFIDQIGDKGGWGYGMNSVESLSMGICTLTMLNETYQNFIPNHPFVNVDETNLENKLLFLINNPEQIKIHGNKGKKWVVQKHHYANVGEKLYEYYQKDGIVN